MLEPQPGLRVVADPGALDRARWEGPDGAAHVVVLRFAPDDAFAVGARIAHVDDPHAIVEPEAGYVGAWLSAEAVENDVVPRIEWSLPTERPALAQGSIAGVPAKLWLTSDADGADRALLIVQAAYAHELSERLR
ncbi:MAG TPA: hypothetical protein VF323_10430 [Candidatus Limnocylindrales bacterium]